MNQRVLRSVALTLVSVGASFVLSCATESAPDIASVIVDRNNATLTALGATLQIVATVYTKTGALSSPHVDWSSDAPAVVSVQGSGVNGTATARGLGTARITASAGGYAATTTVIVDAPNVLLSVQATGTGSGNVTSSPAGISCAATAGAAAGACAANFPMGQVVSLTAPPAVANTFGGWSGACSGTTCQVIMSGAHTVTASFTAPPVTISLTASPPTGGTVSGGGTYPVAGAVTVIAAANSGYTFSNWAENGIAVSSSSSYQFTATTNRTLVATFSQNPFTIVVSANPAEGGTVTGGGVHAADSSVTVTATANSGYTFANWTENGTVVSSSSSYQFVATGDRTLVANFTQASYAIALSALPTNGGTVAGAGTFLSNSRVTVTATPFSGFAFTNWSENGAVVSSGAAYQFVVTASRTLVASFSLVPTSYTVSTSANPSGCGTVSPPGPTSYAPNTLVTVTAMPISGCTFVNWTEQGSVVSTSQSYQFTLLGNRTLVANFSQPVGPFTINLFVTIGAGTVSGAGTYPTNALVTATATVNAGNRFTSWTENNVVVSTNPVYSFLATANRDLTANIARPVTIACSASPSNGGTVTGSGTYYMGDSVTCNATANPGFKFVNWTEFPGGFVVGTNPTLTNGNVLDNHTYIANFVAGPD